MGQFSYACKRCGGHEQFDWITPCVVELALTTGKTIHVEGYYDGYGGVICRVGEDQQVKVHDKQFEEFFEHWGEVQSRGIMCNGSLPAGPRGAPPPRLCVPAVCAGPKAHPRPELQQPRAARARDDPEGWGRSSRLDARRHAKGRHVKLRVRPTYLVPVKITTPKRHYCSLGSSSSSSERTSSALPVASMRTATLMIK